MRKRANQARAESDPPQRPREESEVNLRPQPRPEWKPRMSNETNSLLIIFVDHFCRSNTILIYFVWGRGLTARIRMLDLPREPISFCPELEPGSEQRTKVDFLLI